MNIPDKIYKEFGEEIDKLQIKADMSAVQVAGELIRALKRVTMRNGGTAITVDGVRYDINDNVITD